MAVTAVIGAYWARHASRSVALLAIAILVCSFLWTFPNRNQSLIGILERLSFDVQMQLLRAFHPRDAKVEPVLIGLDESSEDVFEEPLAMWHERGHLADALDGHPRLERAGFVIQPAMEDAAVVRRLVHRDTRFLFEDHDLRARQPGRQFPCRAERDEAGADDDDSRFVHLAGKSGAPPAGERRQRRERSAEVNPMHQAAAPITSSHAAVQPAQAHTERAPGIGMIVTMTASIARPGSNVR